MAVTRSTTPGLRTPPALTPAGRHARRRIAWRVALVAFLALATLAELAWWRLTATATHLPGAAFNQGHNAIWVAHTWAGDQHSPAEYDALATELRQAQIRDIYAHVGPLANDGTIPPDRYPHAGEFVQAMHDRLPGVRVLAWIGQIYRIGAQPDENIIDISLPATRQRIATTSAIFTQQLGFDGIHFDIEPIPNNDSHFLDLLIAARPLLGQGKILSIATPNWVPVARVDDALRMLTNRQTTWWTTFYYQRVSHYVDQIVVMLYNTGMPTAPLYEALAQQETAHILRDVQHASPTTEVIFGIPVYTGPTSRAFHGQAENMRTGLRGVTAGLNYEPGHTAFTGIAIYPEWLVTPQDWDIYDQLWLGMTHKQSETLQKLRKISRRNEDGRFCSIVFCAMICLIFRAPGWWGEVFIEVILAGLI